MSNTVQGSIKRIEKDNYHMFDDMVAWRIIGKERTEQQREASKDKDFSDKIAELNHQGFYVYAAEVMGKFVGWISLMYIPKVGVWSKGFVYVDEIWVAQDFRKKGIGFELMQKAEEVQNELKAEGIRLYTSSEEAKKLYDKCGYHVQGETTYMVK